MISEGFLLNLDKCVAVRCESIMRQTATIITHGSGNFMGTGKRRCQHYHRACICVCVFVRWWCGWLFGLCGSEPEKDMSASNSPFAVSSILTADWWWYQTIRAKYKILKVMINSISKLLFKPRHPILQYLLPCTGGMGERAEWLSPSLSFAFFRLPIHSVFLTWTQTMNETDVCVFLPYALLHNLH